MENKQVEEKIAEAFENTSPDIFASIVSDTENRKGQVILMTEKSRNIKPLIAAAASFILLVAGVFGVTGLVKSSKTVTRVALDVNPSIELEVNAKDIVTDVDALNEDAEIILGDMELEGSKLDVAVNALVGSMLKNGYLSDLANSILVSVENDDTARNTELQKEITSLINDILKGGNIDAAVISQQVTGNTELQKLADAAGVSLGKAQLVQDIVKADNTKKFEDLINLSINDLYLIIESIEDKGIIDDKTEDKLDSVAKESVTVPDVSYSGNASDKSYITKDKALELALSAAGLSKSDISYHKVEFDYDDGKMVYEVELIIGREDYDVEIDAVTGAIIKNEVPSDINRPATSASTQAGTTNKAQGNVVQTSAPAVNTNNFITKDAAKSTALKAAGINEASVRALKVELDREDNGTYKYEVEFEYNGYEYEYEINPTTGTIIKSDKEIKD